MSERGRSLELDKEDNFTFTSALNKREMDLPNKQRGLIKMKTLVLSETKNSKDSDIPHPEAANDLTEDAMTEL